MGDAVERGVNNAGEQSMERGPDRRVRRSRLRFPERRSGFDRRVGAGTGWRGLWEASMRQYRENKSTFLLVLATIIVFNYVDYLLTVRVLRAGGAELNPIMARLFEISPVVAATAKRLVTELRQCHGRYGE